MNRGYMSGLMTGALIGGVLAVWLAPQLDQGARERIMDGSQAIGRRAKHWLQFGRDAAEDMMDRM